AFTQYMAETAKARPMGFCDSFGFRNVVTRSKEVKTAEDLRGLKLRTIQSPIYVKAVQLMGGSPTPMAFGEVYTSLQTGVIDGFEHDASTTYQQHFYEVARFMARTRHIAGVLGLFASTVGLARLPPGVREVLERAAVEAAADQRAMGPEEDTAAAAALTAHGMSIRDIDGAAFKRPAEQLWETEARALGVTSWLEAIRA
nr:TRAP transporter substrate-binding protein [Acidobacteriota bacterium]